VNALSKFERTSATPIDVRGPVDLYADLPRARGKPLELRLKHSGTINIGVLTHPDSDHAVVVDASPLLIPNTLRVRHGGVCVASRADPHVVPSPYVRTGGDFPAVQFDDFCAYAVIDTGTTSSFFTAFIAETQNDPGLDVLASYNAFEEPNWDGHDAQPITKETLDYARRIFRLLPDILGSPDIAPSADGSIGLEWVPDHGPLTKLFMDIGPGAQWHAYWQRDNGGIGRLSGAEIQSYTRTILHNLFAELSM
jgi:hypothetical protein